MNNAEIEQTKYYKILRILTIICFSTIILFAMAGSIVSPDLGLFHESAQIYDDEWIIENPDGSQSAFRMPTSIYLLDGEEITVSTILPDTVDDGEYLALNTGKSFVAYMDGKEIYRFDNTGSILPGRITKSIIVPIQLEENYANKPLTVVFTNGKYERGSINTAYIGSLMGIEILLVKSFALQFVMAVLIFIAAIVTIGIFLYIEKRDGRKAPLIHLAEGVLCITAWIIFDSPLFQLVFGKYYFDGVIGFMLVVVMCYPFLLYFDEISEYRSHMIFVVCETVIVINYIVLTLLHVTNILSYDKVLVYVDLMLVVYIVAIIACTIRNYFAGKDKQHKNVIRGVVGLGAFSVLEIIITILNANMPFKIDIGGLFVLVGVIILLFFAILDQVKVFDILRQETQNAIAATRAKSDFLASMSHEIRTPINAIMGMNEFVLRETDQESVRDYARDINSASENLLRVVNDILDFSKIESGKLEIINDEYDLGELIYDVTSLVNMRAEDKGLKLGISIDESLPTKLYGDDKRVREVITNILNNAVKYTDEGFVKLAINGERHDRTMVLNIVIEDSGQGIMQEDLDKIFYGFSQVNVKKNKNVEGTGLGLSITKQLVELMDGTISVESEFSKGSVFVVKLPQQIVSDEKMGDYHLHRHASSGKAAEESRMIELSDVEVLVVDDTALNLKVISKFLGELKASVTCATSGEQMLKLVTENRYDIILLDHMMPNMDGIETLEASKALGNNLCKDVPVVALTANAILGAKEMYIEAGFDDYLSKPIKMSDLSDLLVKYIPNEKIR